MKSEILFRGRSNNSDFVGVKVDKWSAEVDHYRIESNASRCYDSIRGEKQQKNSVVSVAITKSLRTEVLIFLNRLNNLDQ